MEEVKLDPFLVQSQGKRLVVEVALNPVYRGGPVRTDAAARSERRWLVAMKFPVGWIRKRVGRGRQCRDCATTLVDRAPVVVRDGRVAPALLAGEPLGVLADVLGRPGRVLACHGCCCCCCLLWSGTHIQTARPSRRMAEPKTSDNAPPKAGSADNDRGSLLVCVRGAEGSIFVSREPFPSPGPSRSARQCVRGWTA